MLHVLSLCLEPEDALYEAGTRPFDYRQLTAAGWVVDCMICPP